MPGRKNAAILLLGMGEECAAEILKNLNQTEVETIVKSMSNMEDVSEQEIISTLNAFFAETKHASGLNLASEAYIRKTLVSAIGSDKADTIMEENSLICQHKGFELLKWQPTYLLIDILKEEHPQIITVTLMCIDSGKAADILKGLAHELNQEIIVRMTKCKPVSHYAMTMLAEYFDEKLTKQEKFRILAIDGIHIAANIMQRLDGVVEEGILRRLSDENKTVALQLEDKLFPFEKLIELDSRSLQTLLVEVDNNLLVMAIKGADDEMKAVLYKNMSNKTVSLLKDDLESLGPVKLVDVLEAQKKVVELAKKLGAEDKILLPTAREGNAVL